MGDGRLALRFWGARGTVPTPGADHLRYGGNTSCLSVGIGPDEHVILDCGSGLRMLGRELGAPKSGVTRRFHVLLSHFHFDHLEGLPYFPPLYDAGSEFTFHGFDPDGSTVRRSLEGFVRPPYFPVGLEEAPAKRTYIAAAESRAIGPLRATSLPLNHPDGSLAWKLEHAGRSVVYATDHEHGIPEIDERLLRFCQGADLLVYDATYQPAEYESLRKGWGHSTWYAAVGLARGARVGRLVLFHHHPEHTDDELDRLLAFARADFPVTDMAFEGMTFSF